MSADVSLHPGRYSGGLWAVGSTCRGAEAWPRERPAIASSRWRLR